MACFNITGCVILVIVQDVSVLFHTIRRDFALLPLNVRKLLLRGIAKVNLEPNLLYGLLFDDNFRQMNHNTYYRHVLLNYLIAESNSIAPSFFEDVFKSFIKDVGPQSSLAAKLLPHVLGATVNVDSIGEVMTRFKPYLDALQINSLADWLIIMQQQLQFAHLLKKHPLLLLGLLRRELEQMSNASQLVWEKPVYRTMFNKLIVTCKPSTVNQLLQLLVEFASFQKQALPSWISKHIPLLLRKCTNGTFKLIETFFHGDSIRQAQYPCTQECQFTTVYLFPNGYLKTHATATLVRLFDMIFVRGNIPYLMSTFASPVSTSTRMDKNKEAFWKEIVAKYGMDHLHTHLLQKLTSLKDCDSLPITLASQVAQRIYSELEHTLSDVEKMRLLIHFKQIHTSTQDLKELQSKCFHPDPDTRAQMHFYLLEGTLAQQVQAQKPITAQIIQWITDKVKNDRSDVVSSIFSITTTALFEYVNEMKPMFYQCVNVTDEFSDNVAAPRTLKFVLSVLKYSLNKPEQWKIAVELLCSWIEEKQKKRGLIEFLNNSLQALLRCSTLQLQNKLLQELSARSEEKWLNSLPPLTVISLLSSFPIYAITKQPQLTKWAIQFLSQSTSSTQLFQDLENDQRALSVLVNWFLLSSPTQAIQSERLTYLIMMDPSFLSLHVIQTQLLYNHHHVMDLFLDNLEEKDPHPLLITRNVLEKISKKEQYIFLEDDILWPIFDSNIFSSYLLTSHHALKFTDKQRERFADMLLSYMTSTSIHSHEFFKSQLLKTVARLIYNSNAAVFLRFRQVVHHAKMSSLKPVKLAASVALGNVYQNIPLDGSLRSLLVDMDAERANWMGSTFQQILRFQYLEQFQSSVFTLSANKILDPKSSLTVRKELIRGLRNRLLEFGDRNLILNYFVPLVLKPCWEKLAPLHKDMESLATSVTVSILYTLPLDHFLWSNLEKVAANSTYVDTISHLFSHRDKLQLEQQQIMVKRVHFALLDHNKNPEIAQLAWSSIWTQVNNELAGEIAQRAVRAIIDSLKTTPNRLATIIASRLLDCIRFAQDEGLKSLSTLVQQLNEHASLDSSTQFDNPVYHCFESVALEMMQMHGQFPRETKRQMFETFAHQLTLYHPSLAHYASQLCLFLGDWEQRKSIVSIFETVVNKLSEELGSIDCFSLAIVTNSVGEALHSAIKGSTSFAWNINKQECVLGLEMLLNKIPEPTVPCGTLKKTDTIMLSWICHATLALGQFFNWKHPVCNSILHRLRKYPSFISLFAKHQVMQ